MSLPLALTLSRAPPRTAEQHAINTGTHPAVTTLENIATFKRQLRSLGFSYDWSRELSTTDEGYVRWTQWIFLQLFHKGLASQKEVLVNWCPELGTVRVAVCVFLFLFLSFSSSLSVIQSFTQSLLRSH